MANIRTKIGDIFSVKLDEHSKKYLQFIVSDSSQLNSDVIRAFKKVYPIDLEFNLSEIIEDEVDFYAHCVTKWGVKYGFWEKVGNISNVGNTEHILFRDSSDYGDPQIKISNNWWVWKVNEKQRSVGKLEGQNQHAEVGLIINPGSIVHRMRTGKYDFNAYPAY